MGAVRGVRPSFTFRPLESTQVGGRAEAVGKSHGDRKRSLLVRQELINLKPYSLIIIINLEGEGDDAE